MAGISVGDRETKQTFADELHLNFPLLNDDGSLAKKMGVFWKKQGLARRSLFLVDPSGTVQFIDRDVSMSSFDKAYSRLTDQVESLYEKQKKEAEQQPRKVMKAWAKAVDGKTEEDPEDLLKQIRRNGRVARRLLSEGDVSKSPEMKGHVEALRDRLKLPRVVIKTTKGKVELKLFEDSAPNTVANFINLAEKQFYRDVVFHRVIDGFMIQGGDPTGEGDGGPGYAIPTEVSARTHEKGVISMANAGLDTAGSQFFITLEKQPHLDGNHTVFGTVTSGFDVVKKIGSMETDDENRPRKSVKIKEVTVKQKRDHPYHVQKTKRDK